VTKTEIEKAIQRKKNEYNALLEEYGSGVRPSWVSSDLAHIGIDIQGYKLQLKELEVDF
jgi:heme oxygenase